MTGKTGLIGLAVVAIFIFGSFYTQLAGGPSRTLTTKLDPYGEVEVHLQTQPDPPKTGGIPLTIHITDQKGKRVEVDSVQYDYRFEKGSEKTLPGELKGIGEYSAVAQLTDVGDWRVHVTLVKGSQIASVEFVVRVGANI